MSLHQWYDCSDYESFQQNKASRYQLSPIGILRLMSKKSALLPQTKDLLMSDPFKTWVETVEATNFISVIIWFLLRLVHYVLFIFLDGTITNLTQKIALLQATINATEMTQCHLTNQDEPLAQNLLNGILAYCIGHSCLIILFDVSDVLAYIYYSSTNKVKSKQRLSMAANTFFFRILQFIMAVTMIMGLLLSYASNEFGNPFLVETSFIFRLVAAVNGAWTLMFFLIF